MDEDLKTKHLAQAGYSGPKAQEEARRASQSAIQYHGTETGRWVRKDGRVTNTVYPVKYMVAIGDLFQGFQFYGPFTEDKFAAHWAQNNLKCRAEYRIYPIFDVREDA